MTIAGTDIQIFLLEKYPNHQDLFADPPISKLNSSGVQVRDAVVQCVVGQMLSRSAANTICNRLLLRAKEIGVVGAWALGVDELKACGLSHRKAKTIHEFATLYDQDPERFESWRFMSDEELFSDVKRIWGLSDWTASMLAIFHFAAEDVFPKSDGSIRRAMMRMQQQNRESLIPDHAAPYRSYLALYVWRALDSGVL